MPTRSEILASSSASSSDVLLKPYMVPHQHQPSRRSVPRPLRAQQSFVRSGAVPFPTIREEDEDNTNTPPPSPTGPFIHDPKAEETRVRDWAHEISRRQQNIKELRDKKNRLEQTHSLRTRKLSNNSHYNNNNNNNNNNGGRPKRPSYTYLTSPERKLTPEDVEFIAALHASVVWRLWHASLSPEVFASERLLSTRLHLVLMRHGRQNIPVPPIVALNSASTFATRHMMDKDRPGIQTLPQLVAKSLLRQRKGGRPRTPRSMIGGEKEVQGPSSPLAKGHLLDAL